MIEGRIGPKLTLLWHSGEVRVGYGMVTDYLGFWREI